MQESCPPLETPVPSPNKGTGEGNVSLYLGLRMNLAALDPYLIMNGISGAAIAASVVLPPRTEPWQDRVCKGINTESCQVKSQTKFMQRRAGTVGRNFG